MFTDFARHLARHKLSPTAHRVLWHLIGAMDYGNWVWHTQREIAQELELDPAQVARAIDELRRHDLVYYVPHPQRRRTKFLRVNPGFVWKGTITQQRDALQDWQRHTGTA